VPTAKTEARESEKRIAGMPWATGQKVIGAIWKVANTRMVMRNFRCPGTSQARHRDVEPVAV